VNIEAVALVLRQDDDASETTIHQVRECEIDQSVLAAVGHRWFGSDSGERHEARPGATGEDN
jgi:hypothetical protein